MACFHYNFGLKRIELKTAKNYYSKAVSKF